MIRLDVMLERFPWCEMMELVVVKKGEVVMGLGASEGEVGEGWRDGGTEGRLETLFRAAKVLKTEKAEIG